MPPGETLTLEVEPYKLSEIFSIIPEFEGDQIFLGNFINACECAHNMASTNQKTLLVIHIKNKLRGRAAQLISSRNPQSYLEIKQLLNLHFGDARDLTSLIQDLQRLKQIPGESALTFFNRIQVLNAKMHSCIQKSPNLKTADQRQAQTTLIETMVLNTLLTSLEPRLGQLIRASNPTTLLEAQSRIRRELQLSYFEDQKIAKPQPAKQSNYIGKTNQSPKCYNCGRTGHYINQCRQQNVRNNFPQNSNPNNSQTAQKSFTIPNNNASFNTPQQSKFNNAHQSRPLNYNSTPNSTHQLQNHPQITNKNTQFYQPQQRTHHMNWDQSSNNYNEYQIENYDTDNQINLHEDQYFDQYSSDIFDSENYQDFLTLPSTSQPPENTTQDPISEIQSQIQTLNLDNMDPNLNFPEQNFL